MTQSWSFDAPTGAYKNHALSSKIRMAAIAETKFMQFVRPEDGYGKKKGESITITRVSNIAEPTNGRLVEQVRIPEDTMSITTVSITIAEWGRAVPFTNFSQDLAHFNLENAIQKKLKEQMKLVMDAAAAAAFKTAKVCAIPDGVSSIVFDTDGTPSTTATVGVGVYHIEQIRDYMFGTLKVPPVSGDDYICICTTKFKRSLVGDPSWEKWHTYTDPKSKYNSEVGRIENIRFIETNNFNALSNGVGTGSVLGEAIIFGDDA
ncbi:MAG: N4-gp56 family major capsid protein, partial [Cytophagales bacterium]|nr:N4-gp56 family major capsid protein [Cytophagales bacterium]